MHLMLFELGTTDESNSLARSRLLIALGHPAGKFQVFERVQSNSYFIEHTGEILTVSFATPSSYR